VISEFANHKSEIKIEKAAVTLDLFNTGLTAEIFEG
jgi:hypothetical protein